MNRDLSGDESPAVYRPEQNPWGGPPRVISDEEFARSQRRMKRMDLHFEADIPRSAKEWWRFRSKVLGKPAYLDPNPSGHAAWDAAYNVARLRIEGRAERDTGVVVGLAGYHGSGKTVLAAGLMLLAIWRLRSARYSSLYRACLAMEEGLRPASARSRREVIDQFAAPSLLVFDDCSASAESDASSRFLRELVSDRYHAKRDTVLISNDSHAGFAEFLGEPIVNRARQGGGIIECDWECFRK